MTGQCLESGVGIKQCLEALKPAWERNLRETAEFNRIAREQGNPLRRGTGVAAGWYGCGNTSLPNPSTIRAGIRANGDVALHQGAVDIGQGSNTAIAQLFATALGMPLQELTIVGPDTDVTPDAGKTSASRQTYVSGNGSAPRGNFVACPDTQAVQRVR